PDVGTADQRGHDLAAERSTAKWTDRPTGAKIGSLECPGAVEIDQHQVGVGTGIEHTLARIQSQATRGNGGGQANQAREAEPADVDALGQQSRQQSLDAAKTAPGGPDIVCLLHLRWAGRMVGGDPVDGAVQDRLPEVVDFGSSSQRWRAFPQGAEPLEIAFV